MGDIFILIFKRITIFNSILMIIHCLFHPDLILLLISWIAWLTGKMLNFLSRNKGLKEKKTETNNIVKSFCLKFSRDIDVIYAIFFAIYLVFYSHEKAIVYLILLLFGLYLGNKIAIRANQYIVDQANKNITP